MYTTPTMTMELVKVPNFRTNINWNHFLKKKCTHISFAELQVVIE